MSRKSGFELRLTPEDVRQLRLQLGLPEPRALQSFRELAAQWFEDVSRSLVDPSNERRHLERLDAAIGDATEEDLLPGKIQRAIASMEGLSPVTKNKVRSTGARVIDAARLDGKWRAGNPFTAVKRFRIAKRAYELLSHEELIRTLRCLRADRLELFRVAAAMGPRKGELFGLRKEDVDLAARTTWIRRSHARNTTKTQRPRLVPIPKCVLEDLRRAIEASPSEFVFPDEQGQRMRHDSKLTRSLRAAMGAAGVVLGYEGVCRRKGCGHREQVRLHEARPCPKCGFSLWLVPRVRPVRFQDLRHTAATLHREAGADPLTIKLLLGHASTDPTDDIYSHLSINFQRRELDKLKL